MSATGKIFGGAGLSFIQSLISAKENGEQLPPLLDKLGNLAIKSKASIKDAAIETAKDEANKKLAWIVAGVLGVALVVVIAKK